MTRLALVMIARDEARSIARCLESVRPHVDRMIVVDTGSTDDTRDIAFRLGAEVHDFAWRDDFSVARNAALDRSDADWNLVLDADEWLAGGVDALAPAVLPPAALQPPRFVGCIRILNESGSSEPTRRFLPRILPRGVRYAGRIHEHPISDLPFVPLALEVGHDGYVEAQLARKSGRNLLLLERSLQDDPGDTYLWYQLGRERLVRGDPEGAAEALRTAYRGVGSDAAYRHAIVLSAIQAFKQAERFEEALALVDAEQFAWPDSPDFYFAVAGLYLDWAGRNPEIALDQLLPVAEGAWLRCLAIGEQPNLDGSVPGCGSYLAAGNLAILYQGLGIVDKAGEFAALEQALRAAA